MGLFSRFKRRKEYKLSSTDFETGKNDIEVVSTWFSPEVLAEHPELANQEEEEEITEETSVVEIDFEGDCIDVTFDPREVKIEVDLFIERINGHLNWLASNVDEVENVIVRDLLELKNSTWLQGDEFELKAITFLKSIKLLSIHFFGDGAFEMFFDDGGLFAGHWIKVNVNSRREVEDASI